MYPFKFSYSYCVDIIHTTHGFHDFKIMNKNAQLNMAYSAFRDDRAAEKKNDSKNTVKLQVSILNFELYFIFLKTAFDCSLKLAKKTQNLIV